MSVAAIGASFSFTPTSRLSETAARPGATAAAANSDSHPAPSDESGPSASSVGPPAVTPGERPSSATLVAAQEARGGDDDAQVSAAKRAYSGR